ncbi:hypothetical protein Nepgr_001100 [Nepenthes gracilis]|uniref:Uncharacterized protein n=1 Tax=Nepenthes gracilis TaxID=150966 RepID=A0AAD3P3U5_NEPGR|nr:hypothetical protein Nepgr_001100 [Nepenthes gracilis]
MEKEIRVVEVPSSTFPCLAIQVYQERDILSEAIQRAVTDDILGTPAASSVDQTEIGAVSHFEIGTFREPSVSIVDEVAHKSEVMVEAHDAEEIVEPHEDEEVAAVVDVAQTLGRLETVRIRLLEHSSPA